MPKTKYTVNYFINKFSKIPSSRWICDNLIYENKRCALGHCGVRSYQYIDTDESMALKLIFKQLYDLEVTDVNDDLGNSLGNSYPGRGPKSRILNALKAIKSGDPKKLEKYR